MPRAGSGENSRTIHHAFNGGIVSPEMYGMIDDAIYQRGVAEMRNMIARPHGQAARSPGWIDLGAAKNEAVRPILIPFEFSASQALLIEVGELATPITISSGSITGYFRFWLDDELLEYSAPDAYVAQSTFSGVSGNEITTTGAHGLSNGQPIYFFSSATLPGGLSAGVEYFAIVTASNKLKAAATAGGAEITLTGAGTGTRNVAVSYRVGDLVSYLSINHYCYVATLGIAAAPAPSDVDYWYVQTSAALELPNTYLEEHLPDISYDQSLDVLTLCHTERLPLELRRLGVDRWQVIALSFAPVLDEPTGLIVTETRGDRQDISQIKEPGGADPTVTTDVLQFAFNSKHGFAESVDYVYVGPGTAGTSSYIPNQNYRVAKVVDEFTVQLAYIDGGAIVHWISGTYSAQTLAASPVGLNIDTTQKYIVTAVDAAGRQSQPSNVATATNNLLVAASKNTLTWNSVSGAARYYVYKEVSGLYGFIGEVDDDSKVGDDLTFIDDNITPTLDRTPPKLDDSLSGTDYPGAVGRFQGRRFFAGTAQHQQSAWGTRSGTESDLSYSIPIVDSDRIAFTVASRQLATINHVIETRDLLLLTSSSEIRVTGVNSDILTPSSIDARPQSYEGCSRVRPQVVGRVITFCAARGGHVLATGFDVNAEGYVPDDLSIRAAHLFDGHTIVASAFSKAPYPILWYVRDDGALLGATFLPRQQILAWHRHDIAGWDFEWAASIPRGGEDAVYAWVTDGSQRRLVRMAPQIEANDVFVDLAVVYSGAPATTITGLDHLEGLAVAYLADGVKGTATVASGQITLAAAASEVRVGIAKTSTLKTLPLSMQVDSAFGRSRQKNISKVWARVTAGGDFRVGPDDVNVEQVPAADAASGIVDVTPVGTWGYDGQVVVTTTAPFPLTITDLALEVAIGG